MSAQHGDLNRLKRELLIDDKVALAVVGNGCRAAEKAVHPGLGHFRFGVEESIIVGVSCAHMQNEVFVARGASLSSQSAATESV